MFNRNLKQKISTAIAWGTPDADSIGYTSSEFISLLKLCKRRIEYLEEALRENNIMFIETDFDPFRFCNKPIKF